MSEERMNDPELDRLTERIRQARPALEPAFRDRLIFAAGRASARRGRKGWIAASGALGTLCLALAGALVFSFPAAETPRPTVERRQARAAPRAASIREEEGGYMSPIVRPIHPWPMEAVAFDAGQAGDDEAVFTEPIPTPARWRLSEAIP